MTNGEVSNVNVYKPDKQRVYTVQVKTESRKRERLLGKRILWEWDPQQ